MLFYVNLKMNIQLSYWKTSKYICNNVCESAFLSYKLNEI